MRDAFRACGHHAWSNDIKPADDGSKYHIRGDCMDAIRSKEHWDLIIMHPDCTAMAVSGNRWYGRGMGRHAERGTAVTWTLALWALAKEHAARVVLENPTSVVFPPLRATGATIQYIQPWQFGHGETKCTGLALHGVAPLVPTDVVDGREQRVWKMGPSPDRKAKRSETYQGIADAMAEQWG